MPATEETYRSQPTLHIVFALSSIVMLLTTVWMIMADHLRPWKVVQRRFHVIETAKLKAAEQKRFDDLQAAHKTELDRLEEDIAESKRLESQNARAIHTQQAKLDLAEGMVQKQDTRRKFKKAELDSKRSFYDGMIDLEEYETARGYLAETIVPTETELSTITREYEAKVQARDAAAARMDELKGHITAKEKKRDALRREYETAKRAFLQKQAQYEGPLAFFRGLPIIDLAAPPTKIQQISLPDLTINYNFKHVPRYDRCTTCHLGIDRVGYDTDAKGEEMPAVFHSHPRLTDGATAIDAKGNLATVGLYLDGNGPHKINSFGCTICHGGQGSGTDFTFASHTPNSLEQEEEWVEHQGWHHIHFWDEPMLPRRFLESSCLKCHHQVTDIPSELAPNLRAGYERITKYGCTGCHQIGGEGVFGPDLTDNRQVGPNLGHLAFKASKEWTLKWIRNPHAFRPDTRMPRFYDVSNNSLDDDKSKVNAEVHAITHYLYTVSKPPEGFSVKVPQGDKDKGKTLFFQKGCMACHKHQPYDRPDATATAAQKKAFEEKAAQTFDPSTFPEAARKFVQGDFGPNLVNIAAKFQSSEQGHTWLANWIKAPENYHPKSLMPNLQVSEQDAADIAAWLISVPATWPHQVEVLPLDSKEVKEGIDELVDLYLRKSKTYKGRSLLLAEVKSTVAGMGQDEKLMYLGERTISRLGCFGCHTIPGFEEAKPIGTPLSDWGIKSPAKLDFGHITEYINDITPNADDKSRDGTPLNYQEAVVHQTRNGFLFQKLHRPRSYDYKKNNEDLKSWDDRLRMPQFSWADDKDAIEEVMTFVLGLTGEKVAAKYLPSPDPAKLAIARGERLLTRYNCDGCHTLAMPKYTLAAGTPVTDALPDFTTNVQVAYDNRSKDFPGFYPKLTYDPKITNFKLEESKDNEPADPKTTLVLPKEDGKTEIVIEGMPISTTTDEDENGKPITRTAVQIWKPVTIRGFTFNVGDNLILDPTKVKATDPQGGHFAWLYSLSEADRAGTRMDSFWNRLPPPLIREGLKVQTPWLTSFLKDPYPIRPAVNLRMPRFHFGSVPEELPASAGKEVSAEARAKQKEKALENVRVETRDLANFFAARDRAEFPYQDIPQRERDYLSEQEKAHKDYLGGGWTIITKGLCVQCHSIGQYKPTGGAEVVNGPDLRQVGGRFRSEYLYEWLGQPSRLLPYTAMPQNIPPHVAPGTPTPPNVPKSFEGKQLDQVRAMRDTLLNYVTAVEQQLATAKPAEPPKPAGGSE
jgi:cbb3-type cytochrome oxidase cytochrome c subunit